MLNIVDSAYFVYAIVNFREFMIRNNLTSFTAEDMSDYFGCSEDVLLSLLKSKRKSGHIERFIECQENGLTLRSLDALTKENLHERNFRILNIPERWCCKIFSRRKLTA